MFFLHLNYLKYIFPACFFLQISQPCLIIIMVNNNHGGLSIDIGAITALNDFATISGKVYNV